MNTENKMQKKTEQGAVAKSPLKWEIPTLISLKTELSICEGIDKDLDIAEGYCYSTYWSFRCTSVNAFKTYIFHGV